MPPSARAILPLHPALVRSGCSAKAWSVTGPTTAKKHAQVLQLKSKIEQAMPYSKVIEAKKQHLSFRGKKLDDDAATLETIGIAPDFTLRTQSVTVSDK